MVVITFDLTMHQTVHITEDIRVQFRTLEKEQSCQENNLNIKPYKYAFETIEINRNIFFLYIMKNTMHFSMSNVNFKSRQRLSLLKDLTNYIQFTGKSGTL